VAPNTSAAIDDDDDVDGVPLAPKPSDKDNGDEDDDDVDGVPLNMTRPVTAFAANDDDDDDVDGVPIRLLILYDRP
jgi:hypothetical protein